MRNDDPHNIIIIIIIIVAISGYRNAIMKRAEKILLHTGLTIVQRTWNVKAN